ncbi:hypothetical protein EJ774_21295 [Pandoraea apista]|uniref:Uncharacterized protein n=1 Tax=Pandoraea apista TaxID=93218 RepID=A0ABX9ZLP1_9BURK|nr:hypothetical protein [Pandoraea apista]RSK77892.1 hypothetical protein EJE83_18060 [Pandoraea apista]RUN81879.1 hypothetical protein EJ774_21295 [Pandoraea apista]
MRTIKVSFFGGVAVGVLVAAFWRFPPRSSGDWAAWVQAVGSLAALFAGVVLLHYQAGVQLRHRRSCAAAAIGVGISALEAVIHAPEGYEEAFDHFLTDFSARMRYALDIVKAFPTSEIDSAEAIVQLSFAVEIMERVVERCPKSSQIPADQIHRFKTDLSRLENAKARVLAGT